MAPHAVGHRAYSKHWPGSRIGVCPTTPGDPAQLASHKLCGIDRRYRAKRDGQRRLPHEVEAAALHKRRLGRSPLAARGTCGVPLESRKKCSAVHAGRLHLLAHAHTACSSRQKSAWPQQNEGSGYRLSPKRRKRCRAKGDLRCARRSLSANTVRVQQDGMGGGAPLSADQLHCCSAGVGHTDTIGEFELFLFRPRTHQA